MSLKSKPDNPKLVSRWNRLGYLSVAGLYSTGATLSSPVLLGIIESWLLAQSGVSQTVADLPTSDKLRANSDLASMSVSLHTRPELKFWANSSSLLKWTEIPSPSSAQNPSVAQLPSLPPSPPLELNVPAPNAPLPPVGPPDEPFQEEKISPDPVFNTYRLGVGDAIAFSVQRFPDLSFSATVDFEGNIIVPLLGKIPVAGLSLKQVQDTIQAGFSRFVDNRFLVDPPPTLVLVNRRPAQVTITGEVLRPGYYSIAPGSFLNSALAVAGGATNKADLRYILVRRRSPDNSIIEQQVDLFTPLQNATALPDLALRDGDAVVVPKLEQGRAADYDRSLAFRSTLAQQSITVRVLSYPNGRLGNLPLPNGSTFIDALTALGPSLDDSDLKHIKLMRFDPEQGKVVSQEIDGKRLVMGDLSQDAPLQNEDVIIVGRSLIAKINYALGVLTRPLSDFLGFRSFFQNIFNQFGGGNN